MDRPRPLSPPRRPRPLRGPAGRVLVLSSGTIALRPIDPAAPAIADRIVEIQVAAYAVEAALIGFDGIPQLTETAAHLADLDAMTWTGAFVAEHLVGLIAWVDTDDGVDIDRLAVHPDAARRGIGRRLVRSVPTTKHTTVSTGADNVPAVTLYEREGFERVSTSEVAPGIHIAQLCRTP